MADLHIAGATGAGIAASIRDQIEGGRLAPGAALPTIRALADQLGVNRNTVAAAYASLAVAGVVDARGRAGTVVRERRPVASEGMAAQRDVVNLASGNPDRSLLPEVPTTFGGYEPRLYGETAPDPRLVEWAVSTAVGQVPADHSLVVTSGAIDAIERLLTAHLLPGDAVALEDPCFLSSVGVLTANGFTAIPMAMDAEGVTPEGLAAALAAGARAVVLTPRAHNPTGASITRRRATQLRAVLAVNPDVLVIEDDHFSAIAASTYERATPRTMRRWALVRSVSKFLGPDLRLGLVHCDTETKRRLDARLGGAVWVSTILQWIVGGVLADPATGARLIEARDRYAERSAALVAALTDHGIRTAPPADGLNVWLPLSVAEGPVVDALRHRGWLVRPGADFAVSHHPAPAVRITAATITTEQARAFASDLAGALS